MTTAVFLPLLFGGSVPDAELIISADPVLIIAAALQADGITRISAVIPSPRPDGEDGLPWVQLGAGGGPTLFPVHAKPRVAVWVWGADHTETKTLAYRVQAVIRAMRGQVVGDVPIGRVDVTEPAWLGDKVAGVPLYRLTVDLITRGTVAA